MNKKWLLSAFCLLSAAPTVVAQRKLTEATLIYKVHISENDSLSGDPSKTEEAVSTSYLKGASSRTDLITKAGKQSTIYSSKPPQVILLKEYGSQRYLTRLSVQQWELSNKKYRDASIQLLSDTLRMGGYLCQKALATLPDTRVFSIWYTKELTPLNKEFLPLAAVVPGLVLSFETTMGESKLRYEIDRILLNPVPQVLFDIPESGYRLLEFQ
ncbi:MAG: hypothetical protein ACKO41_06155 [Sphingomonadales bacterium]